MDENISTHTNKLILVLILAQTLAGIHILKNLSHVNNPAVVVEW